MREMKAIAIADDLVEFLGAHPSHVAGVHSVFPHAVNLLIESYIYKAIGKIYDLAQRLSILWIC